MTEVKNGNFMPGDQIVDIGSNVSDLGDLPSRAVGNMLTGVLINIGKQAVKSQHPNVNYGDLPSRALPEIGKAVVEETLTSPRTE